MGTTKIFMTVKTMVLRFFIVVNIINVTGCALMTRPQGIIGGSDRPPPLTSQQCLKLSQYSQRFLEKRGAKPLSAMPVEYFGNNRLGIQMYVGVLVGKVTDRLNVAGSLISSPLGGLGLWLLQDVGVLPEDRNTDSAFNAKLTELTSDKKMDLDNIALSILHEQLPVLSKYDVVFLSDANWSVYPHEDFRDEFNKYSSQQFSREPDIYISYTVYINVVDVTGSWQSDTYIQLQGQSFCNIERRKVREARRSLQNSGNHKPSHVGTYIDDTWRTSDTFTKRKWLSDNGRFFDKQLHALIFQLLSLSCQKLNEKL